MNTGDELPFIDEWLYGRLYGDAQLITAAPGGVHADVAPQGTPAPYVVYQYQAAADVTGANPGEQILTSSLWLVRGVVHAESYRGAALTIAQRIHAVLQQASGSAGAVTVRACVREAPYRLPELLEGGQQVRHLGGLYRIYAHF